MKRFTFRARYFIIALVLFITEVLIALYVHDEIIRPYIGDFLVVILLYCFVKSFVNIPVKPAAINVLLFSFLIETGQYFHLLSLLGLEHSNLAKVVLGNSFAWTDLLMYVLGIVVVMMIENHKSKEA